MSSYKVAMKGFTHVKPEVRKRVNFRNTHPGLQNHLHYLLSIYMILAGGLTFPNVISRVRMISLGRHQGTGKEHTLRGQTDFQRESCPHH